MTSALVRRLLVLAILNCAACGQTGPLVLPGQGPPPSGTRTATPPAAAAPARATEEDDEDDG